MCLKCINSTFYCKSQSSFNHVDVGKTIKSYFDSNEPQLEMVDVFTIDDNLSNDAFLFENRIL